MLLLLLAGLQAIGQTRYNHFPWTYDRTVSAGVGAEGTAFTGISRLRTDTLSLYSAFAIPIKPIRGSIGGYYNQHVLQNSQLIAYGLAYNAFLSFNASTKLRFGVQQNWQRTVEISNPAESWIAAPSSLSTSTDFSALLQRDKLLLGASVENALQKGQRHYNALIGFRELESYSWLKSSPFLLIQLRDGMQLPELRFNYTATLFNTLTMGGSYYKNSNYRWGANAGLKLFRSLWLSAAADFKSLNIQPDALELGFRLNFGKGRTGASSEPVALPESGL